VTIVEASAGNLSLPETLKRILQSSPDLVGITATTSGICAAGELAQALKQSRSTRPILIGGCHVTALPEETLREFPAFDLAVIGEGETTFREILDAYSAQRITPTGLPGTVARKAPDGIHINPPRPLISNLDELPLPAWSALPGFPRAFHPAPGRVRCRPCASVVLTRGCPNRCTFCDRSVFGHQCRSYSPDYAMRLLRDLRDHFGVREILIEDDTFVIRRPHVQEFCERLIAERLDLSWSCLGRADRVDLDLLRLMRKAGCWHISFGIESGNPDILHAVHKNLDIEQITRALGWCREAGLKSKGFFMVGFPGETPATLEETRALACALPLDDISVMQLTPFPGSDIYRTAEHYGTFEKNWRKMNALDAVFVPNGFTPETIEAARKKILRSFYGRPSILARHAWETVRHPGSAPSLFRGFGALLAMLFGRRSAG